eukprot:COSAG01_NODE_3344_length_6226_cov_2.175261_6_plen_168_part_00
MEELQELIKSGTIDDTTMVRCGALWRAAVSAGPRNWPTNTGCAGLGRGHGGVAGLRGVQAPLCCGGGRWCPELEHPDVRSRRGPCESLPMFLFGKATPSSPRGRGRGRGACLPVGGGVGLAPHVADARRALRRDHRGGVGGTARCRGALPWSRARHRCDGVEPHVRC